MDITAIPGGGFTATGAGVEYFRLAALKAHLRLQSLGMISRAGPLRPKIAEEFGLKPRAAYADFINAIQTKMAQLAPLVQKENQE